ncbi:MAG: helix-turn-helix transcriptional regulator [Pyramidobacter sp.]|nr:helix-turn-helix transcriptional regulator [Pyramidobacter sp.]
MSGLTAVKFERFRQGYKTARAVSDKAGIDARRYAMFESGVKYRKITQEEAAAVARVLNVPVGMVADKNGLPLIVA